MAVATTERATTLLKALVRERRLTVREAMAVLQARADQLCEPGYALSERQFRRWMTGDVTSLANARAANVRVVEDEFGWPIDALLATDDRPGLRAPLPPAFSRRTLRTEQLVGWVTTHSEVSFSEAYSSVARDADRIDGVPPLTQAASARVAGQVDRLRVTDALRSYYGDDPRFYAASVGDQVVPTSLVVQPGWTGLAAPLGGGAERFEHSQARTSRPIRLDRRQAGAALERLARVEATGTVLVNNPVFDLNAIGVNGGRIAGELGVAEFAAYALTADLLEGELQSVLAQGTRNLRHGSTPLRDGWLPTIEHALDIRSRLCTGGPVCLVAISEGDHYRLLVQERSPQVLNGTGMLSVIPKAFHQPLSDMPGDVALSATIERELEEELFGRPDVEQLSTDSARRVAPLHPERASEPMRWLHDHPDAWRMECTGFGINMVSGNYEFACLVAVHDPEWWQGFGHLLEANWEADRMHSISSLDSDGISELIGDPRWSNEGLFAFVEGLRRLAEIDPHGVSPAMAGSRS